MYVCRYVFMYEIICMNKYVICMYNIISVHVCCI